MAVHTEGTLAGAEGRNLYWQAWEPEGAAKGVVVVVHGLHEHSARYDWVAEQLNGAGYAVFALDHSGHGRSEGVRGQLYRWSQVLDGVGSLVRKAREAHPDVPLFVLGHSMGGLVSLSYVIRDKPDISGLIVSAPALVQTVAGPALIAAGKVLSVVAPNLGAVALDSTHVSRDPEVVEYHRTNELMFTGKVRSRTAAEILKAADEVIANLDSLTVPLLVAAGTADQIVSPAGADLAYEKAGSADKTLKTYDGLYHEILNEPEKDVVMNDVLDWIKAHSA
ncbi:MAG: alpha/beta hydrolase [Nocardiaceae bacterium]|nr:alpha/beta hydrolase [Nocardiaceae bacterium]